MEEDRSGVTTTGASSGSLFERRTAACEKALQSLKSRDFPEMIVTAFGNVCIGAQLPQIECAGNSRTVEEFSDCLRPPRPSRRYTAGECAELWDHMDEIGLNDELHAT